MFFAAWPCTREMAQEFAVVHGMETVELQHIPRNCLSFYPRDVSVKVKVSLLFMVIFLPDGKEEEKAPPPQ